MLVKDLATSTYLVLQKNEIRIGPLEGICVLNIETVIQTMQNIKEEDNINLVRNIILNMKSYLLIINYQYFYL